MKSQIALHIPNSSKRTTIASPQAYYFYPTRYFAPNTCLCHTVDVTVLCNFIPANDTF